MSTFNVSFDGKVLQIGFGEASDNDQKVRDAYQGCNSVKEAVIAAHLDVLKINGAASLPVAFTIAHCFGNVVPAIAVFDPKLNGYVVVISFSNKYPLGEIVK